MYVFTRRRNNKSKQRDCILYIGQVDVEIVKVSSVSLILGINFSYSDFVSGQVSAATVAIPITQRKAISILDVHVSLGIGHLGVIIMLYIVTIGIILRFAKSIFCSGMVQLHLQCADWSVQFN